MATNIYVKEQDDVLKCKNKNLIVSASAGSGKTSVMIRKIIDYIINDGISVEELLVLTYTKSAAEEMKKKLVDALRKNMDEHLNLEEQLEMVATSDISTFDSFCQRLVKKYFYVLNIDPSFGVLDAGEGGYFMNKALNNALKKIKTKSPFVYELLLDNFAPKRDEEKIKKIILQVYNYTTSVLDFEDFLNKNNDFYDKNKKIAENFLNNYYNSILKQYYNNLEKLKQQSAEFGFLKYVDYINNLLICLDRYFCCKEFGKKIDIVKEFDFGVLRALKSDQDGFKNIIAHTKDGLKKVIDGMSENFVSALNVDASYQSCAELCNAIFELLKLFIVEYSQIKKKNNVYDFDDIERMTISLLQNSEICSQVKQTYKYIFVDEFQDANAIQEKIIFTLENGNLFFVGDTKQSIYAFRQSDPEIFLEIQKKFAQSVDCDAKTLNCNFRTNKNILEFVNQIFNVIMTEKTAGINYKEKAQFDPKAPYQDVDNETCVLLSLIQKNEKQEKLAPKEIYSVKNHKHISTKKSEYYDECLFICNKITEIIGTPIYDKDKEKIRNINFSDITILLSKRGTFLNELANCLEEIGIPYIVSANQNLEEQADNNILYNLLKYSQNSKDDFALYSVISSPLFDFCDSELAHIKQAVGKTENFYEAVEKYNIEGEILNKLKKFKSDILAFSFDVKYKGVFFALSKILINSNYLLKISYEENYQNRKINIEEYINSFCNSKYDKNINDYLHYRETSMREQKMEFEKQSENAVEISTMHSSKGLEYPVVILANLDADNFKSPSDGELKINKEFGVGVKAYNLKERTLENGIFFEACKIKNKLQEQSEKLRLLYVATTRAKNKLILVGRNQANYKKFESDLDVLSTNNFLGLVVGAFSGDLVDKINSKQDFAEVLFKNQRLKIETHKIEDEQITKKEILYPKKNTEIYVDKISEYLNMDLSCQQTNIALKNSVSSVAFDENANINFAPEKLTINEHRQEKASDRGTLYHKILEQINFENVNAVQDVKQFLDCNFSKEELLILNDISAENIYNNICILKKLVKNSKRYLKEQKFVMRVPYKEIMGYGTQEKLLVQGIIDCVVIYDDHILILDYKLSNGSAEYLKNKYKKQLDLYEMALQKGFAGKPVKRCILNLYKNELIEVVM